VGADQMNLMPAIGQQHTESAAHHPRTQNQNFCHLSILYFPLYNRIIKLIRQFYHDFDVQFEQLFFN
jgi:hypothetical protein